MIFRILFALGLIAGIIALFTPVTVIRENGVETPASDFDIVMDDISYRTQRLLAGEPSPPWFERTRCLLEAYVSLVAPARGAPGLKDPVDAARRPYSVVTFDACVKLQEQWNFRFYSKGRAWLILFIALMVFRSATWPPGLSLGLVLVCLYLLLVNLAFLLLPMAATGPLNRVQAALCCLGLLAGLALRAPLGLRARARGSRDPSFFGWELRWSRIGKNLLPFVLVPSVLFGTLVGAVEILHGLQTAYWGWFVLGLPFLVFAAILSLGMVLWAGSGAIDALLSFRALLIASWAARRRKPGAK
jgi:hypothetical protein